VHHGRADRGGLDPAGPDPASLDPSSLGPVGVGPVGLGSPGSEPPPPRRRGLAAPLALPAGFFALPLVGAVAAATHGAVSAGWVLGLAAAIVASASAVAEPAVAPVLGVIGWLTVIGFSGAPYAHLRDTAIHGV
jgi:hypothetical protein